jgi:hypothetical protein
MLPLSKVEFEKRILFIPNAKLVKLHRYTQSPLALLECLLVQGLYPNSLHTHALPEAVKLYLHGLASPTRTS